MKFLKQSIFPSIFDLQLNQNKIQKIVVDTYLVRFTLLHKILCSLQLIRDLNAVLLIAIYKNTCSARKLCVCNSLSLSLFLCEYLMSVCIREREKERESVCV